MSCPQCKKKIEWSWKFCAHCRAELNVDIDLDNYDFGSDFVDDSILVPNGDVVKEYKRILKDSGFDAFINKIKKENNEWKNVAINIAIAGESGTGKSTLINALRNMKAEDEGAAEIGCTETTKEPTPYPYRDNNNVTIWDLPGVGTPTFPKATYLDKIIIERYDFILLVSCTRFKENDMWLANQIKYRHPKGNLIFVRTKIDCDLINFAQGFRQPINAEMKREQLKKIRDECNDYLHEAGIYSFEIFLINSYAPFTFDFGKLANTLINKVTGLKRDAMILTLSAVTNEVVSQKKRLLKEDLAAVALAAALTVKRSTKAGENRLDELMREGKRYQQQFGIDTSSIDVLEHKLKKSIYDEINMRSHAILKNPATFENFYANYAKLRPRDPSASIGKVFDKLFRVRKLQRKCAMMLKFLLDMCAAETDTLHRNLAIWID